jgi:small subunit ribosomal protein S3
MGQKTYRKALTNLVEKKWSSNYLVNPRKKPQYVFEDYKIREHLYKKYKNAGVANIVINRKTEQVQIDIITARPGVVIGKKGADIDTLKGELSKLVNREVYIDITEVKKPDLEARIVADDLANQLARRVAVRRAMNMALDRAMAAGARGIRIEVSGRINGADIARTERKDKGSVPLTTLDMDIDVAQARGETTYGTLGVKVWIARGRISQQNEGR